MHLASLRAVGGSVMIAIPKPILDMLGLHADTKVGLTVDQGRLIIEPNQKPRYTLAELISQCDADAPLPHEDKEWLETPATGREIF